MPENLDTLLGRADRHTLKELAFLYHYGTWRSREDAVNSLSGKAAKEMARRDGRECPEPHLLEDIWKALQ